MPRELVADADRLVGPRRCGDFMTEAVREKVLRIRRERVLRETAGALAASGYPEWQTPEQVSAWVRRGRERDDAGFRAAWDARDEA